MTSKIIATKAFIKKNNTQSASFKMMTSAKRSTLVCQIKQRILSMK